MPYVATNLPNAVLIPLLLSACGLALTTFSILIYHFLILRFCLNRSTHQHNIVDFDQHEDHKLDESDQITLLSLLPVIEPEAGDCAICLGETEAGGALRLLPNCRHVFHVDCVDTWLVRHVSCPVCRAKVFPFVDTSLPSFEDNSSSLESGKNLLRVFRSFSERKSNVDNQDSPC